MFSSKYKMFFITAIIMAAFLFSNNVLADINNITQINFVSDEQTVKKDQISNVFTIQTQNASGVAEDITESTNKLTLSTNSPTGEFSSNSSNWKVTNVITMSKGTQNKNFYYKDSSTGSFTITAELVSGETGKTWSTSQLINISDSDIIDDDTSTTTDDSDITDDTSTTTTTNATTSIVKTVLKTRYIYISTHSSPEDLSDYTTGNSFEITAGRDRISYVGVPIDFNAKHNKKDNKVDFTWSFGDGTNGIGQEVTHIYENPGDYIVVLNSKNGVNSAVSRSNIKILSPEIKILSVLNGLEIENGSDYEINIGEWIISDGYNDFVIPRDTIIASKTKIIISDKNFLTFSKNNLYLKNQSDYIFAIDSREEPQQHLSLNDMKDLIEGEKEVEKILGMSIENAEHIVYTYRENMKIDTKIKENKKFAEAKDNIKNDSSYAENSNDDRVATAIESIDSTSTNNFWNKAFYSSFKKIINRFYDL